MALNPLEVPEIISVVFGHVSDLRTWRSIIFTSRLWYSEADRLARSNQANRNNILAVKYHKGMMSGGPVCLEISRRYLRNIDICEQLRLVKEHDMFDHIEYLLSRDLESIVSDIKTSENFVESDLVEMLFRSGSRRWDLYEDNIVFISCSPEHGKFIRAFFKNVRSCLVDPTDDLCENCISELLYVPQVAPYLLRTILINADHLLAEWLAIYDVSPYDMEQIADLPVCLLSRLAEARASRL